MFQVIQQIWATLPIDYRMAFGVAGGVLVVTLIFSAIYKRAAILDKRDEEEQLTQRKERIRSERKENIMEERLPKLEKKTIPPTRTQRRGNDVGNLFSLGCLPRPFGLRR